MYKEMNFREGSIFKMQIGHRWIALVIPQPGMISLLAI